MQSANETARQPLTAAPKTREQAAYEALRTAIITGRWRPGESLVVSRIALDLGISRIPVTNAMKQLASEGFVRMRPHQEAVVALLDAAEIREIHLMRAALEALAAAEAATRTQQHDIDDLRVLNDELGRIAATPGATLEDVRAVDKRLHAHIRAIAGMPHLAQTLQNLADQCEYYRVCLLDVYEFAPPAPERHTSLIDALERHDSDGIQALMKTHILEGMHLILRALESAS